jgi:hypothetical protein
MARTATSQLAREAAEIRADDRFLIDQPTVVNPVTGQPGDTRKVSPAVLAEGHGAAGGYHRHGSEPD